MHPHAIMTTLKQQAGYFNRQNLTLAGLFEQDNPEQQMGLKGRSMWAGLRMDPTDIADITGATYTYLINGHGPEENWTGLFRPGKRARLRGIHDPPMSTLPLPIPCLPLNVCHSAWTNVRP